MFTGDVLRTHRPLQEGLRLVIAIAIFVSFLISEPIVHYKKDCDGSLACECAIGFGSEPIVHYKKDCDYGDQFILCSFQFSEPIVHYKKDCDG